MLALAASLPIAEPARFSRYGAGWLRRSSSGNLPRDVLRVGRSDPAPC
jgi:hypothetical protein